VKSSGDLGSGLGETVSAGGVNKAFVKTENVMAKK